MIWGDKVGQIAYKVVGMSSLLKAIKLIATQNPGFVIDSDVDKLQFHFESEPTLSFTLSWIDCPVQKTYPSRVESYFLGSMGSISPVPYTIDYQCYNGGRVVHKAYIDTLTGTFILYNTIPLRTNDTYYIFFGEDWLSIVVYENQSSVEYIIFSCRSEQDGSGGYILSNNSALIRVSDNHVFPKIWPNTSPLLCYYNKYGTYNPDYPVEYIDTSYCSVVGLDGYSERVTDDGVEFSVSFRFKKNWYSRCTCSLLFSSADTNKLPVYNNLVNYIDSQGSPAMSNTLNGISLLLPNYIYLDVSPYSSHKYKYIFDTPEICYCSMYNMLSGKIVQQDYPVYGDKFMCFSLSSSNESDRKNNFYKGVSFVLPERYDNIITNQSEV